MAWWFKGSKNRKLKAEGRLETLAARRQTLAARWRVGVLALGVAMGASILLLAAWRGGDWLMRRLIDDNPTFALRFIDIQTDGVLPVEQLRQWAGVNLGENTLSVDLSRIRRRLELAPQIREVLVERVLPNRLRLRVKEREPLVQAHVLTPRLDDEGLDVSVYYLDDEGFVMRPTDLSEPGWSAYSQERYSILTGLSRSDVRPGYPAKSPQVFAALDLLQAFGRSPMAGLADLSRIDLSGQNVLLVTTSQGGEITFGLENPERQLRRWRAVYDYARDHGRQIATLDLSVTNNSPVLWLETNQVPVLPPLSLKTSRTRSKHV